MPDGDRGRVLLALGVQYECLLSPTSTLYYCLLLLLFQVNTITTICVDLADLDATKKAVETLGPIHLLVNNAGVVVLQHFLDVTPENYDRLLHNEQRTNANTKFMFVMALLDCYVTADSLM